MKCTKKMLVTLMMFSADVWAQVPPPQTMKDPRAPGTPTETYSTTNLPYSSQASFNMMEATDVLPQSAAKTTAPGYIGVLGEKWETDKRGRRSTFIHNGQEMSTGYGAITAQPHRPPLPLRLDSALSVPGSLMDETVVPALTIQIKKSVHRPPKP